MKNLELTVLLNAIDKISAPVRSASKSVHELSAKLKESKSIHRQLNQQNKQHQAAMKQYASAINPLKSKLDSLNQELEQAKQKSRILCSIYEERSTSYCRISKGSRESKKCGKKNSSKNKLMQQINYSKHAKN